MDSENLTPEMKKSQEQFEMQFNLHPTPMLYLKSGKLLQRPAPPFVQNGFRQKPKQIDSNEKQSSFNFKVWNEMTREIGKGMEPKQRPDYKEGVSERLVMRVVGDTWKNSSDQNGQVHYQLVLFPVAITEDK
jgi:hypothetical protein